MAEQHLVVLGFDYGTRRTGVAVGQTLTRTAQPLQSILTGDWPAISRLIAIWRPGLLVVGDPLQMDGTQSAISTSAMRFSRRLAGRYGLRVALWDECLTSYEGRILDAVDTDAAAACLILESWLRQAGNH